MMAEDVHDAARSHRGPGLPIALLLAGAVGAALAHLGAVAMPFQIGAVIDTRGVSPAAAGLFGFLELGTLALAMVVSAPVVARVPPAGLALAACGVAALANAAIFGLSIPFPWLCVFAMIAGSGYGGVFASTIAGISCSPKSDRIFALSSGASVVIVVGLISLFAPISARFGSMGPFLGIAILLVATMPFLLGFGWTRAGPTALADGAPVRSQGAVALYILWAGFSLGSGVAWSFAERMARAIGLDAATIGIVLSASTAVGVGGTILAGLVASRWKRIDCASIGLAGTALGCLLFSVADGVVLFTVGALCFWVASMFFYCTMLGAAAALDPSGRVGTSGGGFDRLGFACGAPLGGVIVDHAGFATLGIAAFAICMLPAAYALPVLGRELAARDL